MAAQKGFSRRDFLKATGLSVVPLAVQHLPPFASRAFAQAVELSMWTWYQEQQDEFPILDAEFNESHTDTKITNTIYSNTTEYLPVLTSALAGGVAADIFGPHVYAIEYGLAGQTVDLNPLFGEDFMSQFFPATRRQFSAGDAQYALGWMAQTFGFFYNPALFEAAGLTSTPETWDELIEMCQQIKAAGIIPWTFNESDKWLGADFFLPLIAQATDDTNLVEQRAGHHRARTGRQAGEGRHFPGWHGRHRLGHVNRALLRRRRGHDDGRVVGAAGHPPERFAGIRVLGPRLQDARVGAG